MNKSIFAFILCAVFLFFSVDVTAEKNDVLDIIKKIDELYRSSSSRADIEMIITTPHWERTLLMKTWSKGMEKTFIRILEPKKEKGIATLRIGNEMWNYLPKANKVIKVPPSMMMGSWMGSDFTNDDLVKESSMLDDYEFSRVFPENTEENVIYVELVPKEDKPIVWGKIVVAVENKDYLPVKYEYYDEDGTLMRIMTFSGVKVLGGKKIPAVMEVMPTNKENRKTVIKYIDAEFDIELDEELFTLRNLRTQE